MPNWCSVNVTVYGPEYELKKLHNELLLQADEYTHVSVCSTFVPMPDDIGDGWYNWALTNWGCKWPDDMYTEFDEDDETLMLTGQTPWSPPIDGYLTASKLFPNLVFDMSWDESGMCFMGAAVIANGELLGIHEILNQDYPSCNDWDDEDAYQKYMDSMDEAREECSVKAAEKALVYKKGHKE